jgi:hypothetical protein
MSLLEIPPILPSAKPSYRLAFSDQEPSIKNPSDPLWRKAESLEVASFHPRTGAHRPRTTVRLLYNTSGIFIRFDVEDCWVRSVHTRYQDPVSKDSCVEWFVAPQPEAGYYNIEANCGGTLLIGYHPPGALPTRVSEKMAKEILLHTSLPLTTEPEIPKPLDWTLAYFIPFSFFGSQSPPGQTWRANFYKCGSDTSHPHWASWSPIGEKLSFHQPETFGELIFEAPLSSKSPESFITP